MSYQWTVVNQDPGSIQFCVIQSGFYRNCVTVNGSSTLPFVIPDSIVQQFGTPTGYLVTYTRVQVTTSTKPLPSNGSTIVVPAYSGCNPLLTQGQGYPPIVYCDYPGSIVLTGKSTPGIFINGYGAVSGESVAYGVQQSPFTICTGQGHSSCKTYPNAKVYLIGNWTVQGNQYVDNESGKVYCACPNASAYVIPYSDLPKATSTTSTSSTGGVTGLGVTSNIANTNNVIVEIKNTCSVSLIARGEHNGLQYFRSGIGPSTTIKESLPVGSIVQFLYDDEVVSEVTVRYDGQRITPTRCPHPSTALPPPPPGKVRVFVRNPCRFPITIIEHGNPKNSILVAHPGFNGSTLVPSDVSSVQILYLPTNMSSTNVSSAKIPYNYGYDLGTNKVTYNAIVGPLTCQPSKPFRVTSTTSITRIKLPSIKTTIPLTTSLPTITSTTSVRPSASQFAVASTKYVTTTVPVTSTVSVPVTSTVSVPVTSTVSVPVTKTVIVPVTNTLPITVTNTIPVTTTVTSTLPVTTTVSTPPPSQPTKIGIFGILGLLIQGLDRLLGINNLQPIQSQVTPGQRKPGCQSCN